MGYNHTVWDILLYTTLWSAFLKTLCLSLEFRNLNHTILSMTVFWSPLGTYLPGQEKERYILNWSTQGFISKHSNWAFRKT